jgi:long-chain acyl-CoA synthetase
MTHHESARAKWDGVLKGLNKTTDVELSYWEVGHKRRVTYAQFGDDIAVASRKLRIIQGNRDGLTVGVVGGISYTWLLIDFACFFGGHLLVALPEKANIRDLKQLISAERIDLLLAEFSLYDDLKEAAPTVMEYGRTSPTSRWEAAEQDPDFFPDARLIRDIPAIYFSSGTSGRMKRVELKLVDKQFALERQNNDPGATNLKGPLRRGMVFLVYLPLSGAQQRGFIRLALLHQLRIVLSNQKRCLEDIITERPHVMVSVPAIYEVLAKIINRRIRRMPRWKRYLIATFRGLTTACPGLGRWCWSWARRPLLKDVDAIYGGRAEYFVSGSALISRACLATFRSIGVRIYEGYGLSEVGIVALNTLSNYRFGSVGKPRGDIRISAESEILVKFNPELHDRRNIRLTPDGYICTGDLGRLDNDGFLFVTGRKDDVWVMPNGIKVLPDQIEEEMLRLLNLEQAFAVRVAAFQIGIVLASGSNPTPNIGEVKTALQLANRNLNIHPGITRFLLRKEPWSTESVFYTSNLKLKRSILELYFAQVPFDTI